MRNYEILTGNELNKIHESTLDIMENLGVKFTEQAAVDIFSDAGISVNEEMVLLDLALVYRYSPDTKYCNDFEIAESKAKANKLGIWKED